MLLPADDLFLLYPKESRNKSFFFWAWPLRKDVQASVNPF
jgi:hypothetical protein